MLEDPIISSRKVTSLYFIWPAHRVTCIKELREAGLTVHSEARETSRTAAQPPEEQYEDPETVLLLQHKVGHLLVEFVLYIADQVHD
jgi:hypothetical protein